MKEKSNKYRLIEITSSLVTTHLNTPEYQKFIEYARNKYENQGYPRMKNDKNDWTIKDYWEKINGVIIPANDIITIVEDYRENRLFFPFSRLFKNEKKDIPRELRFTMIQNAKKELFY